MEFSLRHSLLTPNAMANVDAAAAQSGLSSLALMERAGQAVAAAALRHYPQASRYVVLCGPGNNGGDGYVAVTALIASGASVAVFYLGEQQRLSGDARQAFEKCPLPGAPLEEYTTMPGDVVIDALLGAGLSRDVPAILAEVIDTVRRAEIPVIAVDLPSGLCGRRGVPLGAAFQAARTVTFMARKPGHLLLPGRELCGEVEVFDIGIPARIIAAFAGNIAENHPFFWRHLLPVLSGGSHKFTRGHLTVFSGPATATGAARLAASAGAKAGAGLVTVAAPDDALAVLSATLTSVMVTGIKDTRALQHWLNDSRHNAFVLGPGFGINEKTRQFTLMLREKAVVLDADGISAFRDAPGQLFDAFSNARGRLVLTPHEGEFARLFPAIAADKGLSKVEKAQAAAALSHAAIVYKGADTVIAARDGRAFINSNAPPSLATAGSGDVLAGIIGALMAQGMPPFEAAAAGVWLHGEAGRRAGPAIVAEDLVAAIRPQA